MKRGERCHTIRVFLLASLCIFLSAGARQRERQLARQILRASAVKGGLIVHIGCGDGRLTAALRASDSYLVHGLDRDAGNIERARKYIQSLGFYGRVAVEQWTKDYLPYADNLVNLIVSENLGGISMKEVMRVLCPEGVAYIKKGGRWTKAVKTRPKEMDEWTHYLHDSSGNAVAHDTLVGPPRYMQWVAKPLWCRSHEFNSSISALVSARGRIFYILDEGIIGLPDGRFPAHWSLIARDAFNGILLWKRPVADWGWRQWNNPGLWSTPMTLPRRLVAQGNRLFVTLGYRAPLSILNAETGAIIRLCEETKDTDEIVYSQGILVLRVREIPTAQMIKKHKNPSGIVNPEFIAAIKADSGEVVWKYKAERIVPLSLAVAGNRVCFHNFKEIVCLDLKEGKELWRAPCIAIKGPRKTAGTLVMYRDVVLYTGTQGIEAYSADSGRKLWTGPPARGVGATQPPDLFVADGLVWSGRTTEKYVRDRTTVSRVGYDPGTGSVRRQVTVQHLISPLHHFRCYRSKATDRYLLLPKRGVEFLDLEGDNHMRHDWLRAPCSYGFMPCNGLLYVPPHQCFCYPGVKLTGFNALTSEIEVEPGRSTLGDGQRLIQGPAYKAATDAISSGEEDWPTYRHDAKRSGRTVSAVPVDLTCLWQSELCGRITPAAGAGGRLLTAEVDTHHVYCLDADRGQRLWSYTVGGPVDSPPTIYKGLVLFGSADGWLYCLRASDGKLAWRFQGAPEERRVVAFGRVESAWPVHGSVLIQDDVVYFAAGRSSFLDGGIYVYGLDVKTGKVLHQTRLSGPYPDVAKEVSRPFDMEGTRSDILVSDGRYMYLFQVMLDRNLRQQKAPRITSLGDRKVGLHLMSTGGFLDDSWFDRTYWAYSNRWPGYYFAYHGPKVGQILVFDTTTTYGVHVFTRRARLSPVFTPGQQGYELFADRNDNELILEEKAVGREKGPGYSRAQPPEWSVLVPIRIRAMVLAGETLFIAGPPDVLDPDDPLGAFQGRKGALLWAVSAKDGRRLAEYKLDSPPVFDGMIAANGRLYISTRDGRLICMGKKE